LIAVIFDICVIASLIFAIALLTAMLIICIIALMNLAYGLQVISFLALKFFTGVLVMLTVTGHTHLVNLFPNEYDYDIMRSGILSNVKTFPNSPKQLPINFFTIGKFASHGYLYLDEFLFLSEIISAPHPLTLPSENAISPFRPVLQAILHLCVV
jgi:hypothetical protein